MMSEIAYKAVDKEIAKAQKQVAECERRLSAHRADTESLRSEMQRLEGEIRRALADKNLGNTIDEAALKEKEEARLQAMLRIRDRNANTPALQTALEEARSALKVAQNKRAELQFFELVGRRKSLAEKIDDAVDLIRLAAGEAEDIHMQQGRLLAQLGGVVNGQRVAHNHLMSPRKRVPHLLWWQLGREQTEIAVTRPLDLPHLPHARTGWLADEDPLATVPLPEGFVPTNAPFELPKPVPSPTIFDVQDRQRAEHRADAAVNELASVQAALISEADSPGE